MTTFGELLDTGEFYDGTVCSVCLMGIASGDWPAIGDGSGWDADRDSAADVNLGAYDVTVGHVHIGEWADTNCWHFGTECGDDCDCERTEFSSRGCSVCGTYLSGYRHDVIMVNRADLTNQSTETGN